MLLILCPKDTKKFRIQKRSSFQRTLIFYNLNRSRRRVNGRKEVLFYDVIEKIFFKTDSRDFLCYHKFFSRRNTMKKIIATSALMLSMCIFSSFAIATDDCIGDDCTQFEPVINSGECIGANCSAGWAETETNGNQWAQTDIDDNSLWAAACNDLQIATMAGAPENGIAYIANVSSQGMDVTKVREDGTAGLRIQDMAELSLQSATADGGITGGLAAQDNRAKVDLWSNSRPDGVDASMHANTAMAGMLCVADGTTGILNSQIATNAIQNTDNGVGVKTFQQVQTLGQISINAGHAAP